MASYTQTVRGGMVVGGVAYNLGISISWYLPGSRTINYLTKKYRFRMNTIGVVKVIAPTYPVYLDLIYRNLKNGPVTISVVANDANAIRVKPHLVDSLELRIYGSNGVSNIFLSTSMGEMPV